MKRILGTIALVISVTVLIRCGGSEEPSPAGLSSTSATSVTSVTFGEGFYGDESFADSAGATHHFRWMGLRGTAHLPPTAGAATLKFSAMVPSETLEKHPEISVAVSGIPIATFTASKLSYELAYPLAANQLRADQPSTLTISTTQTIVPKIVTEGKNPDARALGLKITDLRLEPVH